MILSKILRVFVVLLVFLGAVIHISAQESTVSPAEAEKMLKIFVMMSDRSVPYFKEIWSAYEARDRKKLETALVKFTNTKQKSLIEAIGLYIQWCIINKVNFGDSAPLALVKDRTKAEQEFLRFQELGSSWSTITYPPEYSDFLPENDILLIKWNEMGKYLVKELGKLQADYEKQMAN